MPNHNGMGTGPRTEQKLDDLDGLLKLLFDYAFGAIRHNPWWPRIYPWVDLTSGPGLDRLPDGSLTRGSPPIAMDRLRDAAARLGVAFHGIFYERHPDRYRSLEQVMRARYGPPGLGPCQYQLIEGDSFADLDSLCSDDLPDSLGGFIYDPTEAVDFSILERLASAPARYRYDLLIYISGTTHKRVSRAFQRPTLVESLQLINKRKWIVRKPTDDGSEWTWFLGTNNLKLPAWHKRGFRDITSPDGQVIIDQLNLTRKERYERDHGGGLI